MTRIEKLERKYPDLLFIESDAEGLSYATAKGDDRITLFVMEGDKERSISLSIEQIYALGREIMGVIPFIGRGRPQDLWEKNWQKSRECQ